jgi:hypothetical protein
LLLASVFKHPSFSEEEEWRLIVPSHSLAQLGLALRFRDGRSGIVPYVAVPLTSEASALEVHEVMIGPNPHQALAKQAVKSLLEANGVAHKGVFVSDIPFRAT